MSCTPDFNIDINAEQRALERADLVVLQHPMQWYSFPPLLKLWIDKVLEHGWAYGHDGNALVGKRLPVGGDQRRRRAPLRAGRLSQLRSAGAAAAGHGDLLRHELAAFFRSA